MLLWKVIALCCPGELPMVPRNGFEVTCFQTHGAALRIFMQYLRLDRKDSHFALQQR